MFDAVNVREGMLPFGSLWNLYQNWESQGGHVEAITMVQSAPPESNRIRIWILPLDVLLPGTVQFAQTFYPNMRFGLALALMNNGFFTYDFGDTGSARSTGGTTNTISILVCRSLQQLRSARAG